MSQRVTNFVLAGIALCGLGLAPAGCEQPFMAKPSQAPPMKYCFDTVGHRPGAKPWILGGTCCCMPSAGVLHDWQAHGYFVGQTVEDVIALYHAHGIALATDHRDCNNACEYGPHVVKGGKCMVPPTPGTDNYEEVLFGVRYGDKERAPKASRDAAPSAETAYQARPTEKESKPK